MTKKVETKIVEDMTPAEASLHANSMPSGQPDNDPSRSAMMAQAIAIMGGIEKGDLSRFLESLAQIGHEADLLPGNANADANKSTIQALPSDAVKEDVALLFVGEDLTEDFKNKAASLVEDVVAVRLAIKVAALDEEYNTNLETAYAEVVRIEEEFETKLQEAYTEIAEDLTDKVDQYMNHVAESWLEDNKIALETAMKTEVTESFIEGLKTLFKDHYIEIPEDKVDVVANLSTQVEELEAKLNAAINETIELKNVTATAKKEVAISEASEGLVVTDAERLRTLAESIDFNGDTESFKNRLSVIKENYFGKKTVTSKVATDLINEDITYTVEGKVENVLTENVIEDSTMAKYAQSISRAVRKA